jgi:HK97 family phage major capsid protein
MELELKQISDQIAGIGADVKESVSKVKSELNEGYQKAKAELSQEVEAKMAKIAAQEEEIGKLKASAQRLEVRLDEADQKAATRGMGAGAQKAKDFNVVLQEELEKRADDIEKMSRKERLNSPISIDLKAVGDISTTNVTGTLYGQLNQPGIILNPDRKRHMREILPGGRIGAGNEYTFMREAGPGEGNPAPVAEGATKPQFDFDLEEAKVSIETIAGWVRVTRKAMSNIPGFISYLQTQMPKRLLKVEDAQILYGTGTSPQIKGLLTSGNFVASASTNPILIERILEDVSVLEDTHEREATAIAMRPITYNSFFRNKASGSGEYDLPANVTFVNGQLFIGGVPVVRTTALAATDYIVGDFTGAQFLVQEGMRIEFFEQDRDNVITNKVTVRIEETVALPVFGSNYFIKGATSLT